MPAIMADHDIEGQVQILGHGRTKGSLQPHVVPEKVQIQPRERLQHERAPGEEILSDLGGVARVEMWFGIRASGFDPPLHPSPTTGEPVEMIEVTAPTLSVNVPMSESHGRE